MQNSGTRWWPKLGWVLLALALVLFGRRCLEHGGFLAEDAYISFRFAENLAAGEGLVWNVGGERVEGYTSPLHIALLALMVVFAVPIKAWAVTIGLLSVLGLAAVYILILRREAGAFTPLSALVLGCYLVDSRLAIHATAGLDTLMYAVLLAANFLICIRFAGAPTAKTAVALAAINLASLLGRPDAAPFIAAQGIVLGVAALKRRRTDPALLRWGATSYAMLVAVGLAYLGFKLAYFGYVLPNPFYVKAADPAKLDGLGSVLKFLGKMKWLLPFVLLGAIFSDKAALRDWWRRPNSKLEVWLLAAPVAAFLLYFTTVIQEVNYANRFEYAAYFFFVLATGGLLGVGRPLERLITRRAGSAPAAYGAAAVVLVLVLAGTYKALSIWFPWFEIVETKYYGPIGRALASTGLKDDGKLIFDSAGVVPYVSRFDHIDPVGLTDNTLSGREPITVKARERYLWESGADVYVGPEPPAGEGAEDCASDPVVKSPYAEKILLSEQRIRRHAAYYRIYGHLSAEALCDVFHHRMRRLRDEWTMVGEVPFPVASPKGFTTFAYVRTDSPHHDELVQALEAVVDRTPDQLTPETLLRE